LTSHEYIRLGVTVRDVTLTSKCCRMRLVVRVINDKQPWVGQRKEPAENRVWGIIDTRWYYLLVVPSGFEALLDCVLTGGVDL